MQTFKKILVPIDLADFSSKIVPYVKIMAERFDAETHLLYVERVLEAYTSGHLPDLPTVRKFEKETMNEAVQQIKELSETFFKDCHVSRVTVLSGDVAEEIVSYVDSEKMGLVIIGTHGRKGIDRVIFGSVAEKVLQMSSVPVLALNPYRVSKPGKFFDFTLQGDKALEEELKQYT